MEADKEIEETLLIPNLYRTAKISHPGIEAVEAAPASPDCTGGLLKQPLTYVKNCVWPAFEAEVNDSLHECHSIFFTKWGDDGMLKAKTDTHSFNLGKPDHLQNTIISHPT